MNKGVSPYSSQAIVGVGEVREANIFEYWSILVRYKWSILFFILLGVLAAIVIIYSTPSLYRSKARLLVESIAQNKQASLGSYEYVDSPRLYYQTQYEIITSRNIAKRVITELDLLNNASFMTAFENSSKVPAIQGALPDSLPVESGVTEETTLEPYVDLFLSQLRVSGGDDSQIIDIQFDALEPVLASNIANAVAESYINFGESSRGKGAEQATDWLTKQGNDLRMKLEESEIKLQEFKSENGMLDSESTQAIARTKLSSLAKQLVAAQSARSDAEARYNQLLAIREGSVDIQAISAVLNNKIVATLKEAEINQAKEVSELAQRYGPKHPKLAAANIKLVQAQRAVKNEINIIINNLKKEVAFAKSREWKLEHLIGREEGMVRDVQSKDFQLSKLERKVENNYRMYEAFLAKANEIESKTNFNISNITILDPGHPIFTPISPNKSRIIILGTVFGGFFGILLAFLRNLFDQGFENSGDVDDVIDVNVARDTSIIK